MDIVNELTVYEISIEFKDTKGADATPSAASYRVTDDQAQTIVVDTPISLSGPTAQIMIPANVNVCTIDGGDIQARRVVIKAANLAQIVHKYKLMRIK